MHWSYHDIHVKPIGATILHELGLGGQIGEVRGEHGGGYLGPRNPAHVRILTHAACLPASRTRSKSYRHTA